MDLTEKTSNQHRHPWELSRAQNILALIATLPRGASYVDIGAGDCFFATLLAEQTNAQVTAVDNGFEEGVGSLGNVQRLHDLALLADSSADCLVMMDVLEHVPNEKEFLDMALSKLKPNGYLVLTVPAMQFLFSSHDVFLKHYRRYEHSQLTKVLRASNLQIYKSHYFYASLFWARSLACAIEFTKPQKVVESEGIGAWKYAEQHLVTRIIRAILNFDFALLAALNRFGIRLPGLSLLAICQKK